MHIAAGDADSYLKTQHNRPRKLRLPALPERENRLTWKREFPARVRDAV
jgi:hypothetical protein